METTTPQPSASTPGTTTPPRPSCPPLELETRTAVDTACAAHHLNRQPQTMRGWASRAEGPLRPIRVNGRLAWSVADLKRILGVGP
jgi:hypothetical protein